jgi:hypothetical protein
MIKGKTRHQLFLPFDLSKRVAAMARSQKRSRSDLLAEILTTHMTRRAATEDDDRVLAKLGEVVRMLGKVDSETAILSHSLSRLIRHQLIYAAVLPPPGKEAEAAGEKRYQAFLDSVARLMARRSDIQEEDDLPPETNAPRH